MKPAPAPHRSRARSRERSARATRRCVAGAALATGLVMLLPMLVLGPLFGLDLTLADLGTSCAVRHALADHLGLWLSPWIGNGGVLALQPAAQVFYPLRWPFLVFPADWGSSVLQAVHLVAGAAATAWLARTFRLRPGLAMAAGIAFALSGPTLDLVRHAHYVVAATWLPLAWAAARHGLQRPSQARSLVWLALALAGLLLGGEPQAFAVAVVVLAIELALRFARGPRPPWSALGMLASAVGIALLVSAVLLVPLQAELALSRRGQPLPLDRLMQWSFGPSLWPAALLPGDLFRDGAWAFWRDGEVEALWNPSPYLGVLFVLLATQGLRGRRIRAAAIVAVVGCVAALGDSTPIWPWFVRLVPGLDWFRFPVKYLVVTALACSLCAAAALQRMRRDARRARLLAALSSLAVLALLAFTVAVQAAKGPLETLVTAVQPPPFSGETSLVSSLQVALVRAALPLLAGMALWRWRTPRCVMLVALCWVLDVGIAGAGMLRAGPPLADLRSPLRAVPGAILCHSSDLYASSLQAPDAVPGWGQAALHRLVGLPELQACDRLTSAVPYSPLASRVALQLYRTPSRLTGAAARALGCSHVVAADAVQDPDLAEVPWQALGVRSFGPRLYAVRDPMPETAVVEHGVLFDEAGAIAALLSSTSARSAWSVLDDPLGRLGAAHRAVPATGAVEIAGLDTASPTQVAIHLAGRGPAVVMLRRAHLAGWRASMHGKAIPVLRAAGSQLAVLVDEAHDGVVLLQYRPPHLALAAALSLAGGGLWIGLWWWTAPRRCAGGRRLREQRP